MVETGARIGEFVYLAGPHLRSLPGTIVRAGAVVGPGVWVRGGATEIGPRASIEAGVMVLRGARPVIGAGVVVGPGPWIGGDARIAPGTTVPAGARVGC